LVATEGVCVRSRDIYEGLDALVSERGAVLLGAAVLLAGSRTGGEDLLQTALERLVRHWRRIDGDKEAYLRRTLYHLAVDQWRVRRGVRQSV
jgi:DNA-directed RNA polymerase specialized sigma24 family protein